MIIFDSTVATCRLMQKKQANIFCRSLHKQPCWIWLLLEDPHSYISLMYQNYIFCEYSLTCCLLETLCHKFNHLTSVVLKGLIQVHKSILIEYVSWIC